MELYPTPGPERDLDGCQAHTGPGAPHQNRTIRARPATGSVPRGRRKVHQTAAAVDTATLLLIDPSYLGPEGERIAHEFAARGLAVLIVTGGDGWHPVETTDEGLLVRPAQWCTDPATAFHPMAGDEYLKFAAAMDLHAAEVDQ